MEASKTFTTGLKTAVARVNITVSRNENPPVFNPDFYSVQVAETLSLGSSVILLTASDLDVQVGLLSRSLFISFYKYFFSLQSHVVLFLFVEYIQYTSRMVIKCNIFFSGQPTIRAGGRSWCNRLLLCSSKHWPHLTEEIVGRRNCSTILCKFAFLCD